MADFSIRSDSINVEQIMEQIRARIREKRGVDYTEAQIRELAAVKLEKFLDPRGIRSDLLDEFRRMKPAGDAPQLPNFAFDESTLYDSHRGPIRWIRKLLNPLLKLFFNPNPLIQALHIQSRLNTLQVEGEAARRARDQLTFEVLHNLVVETTRLGIEVKNLAMRVESISSRLDFNERRARALESAVVYKPEERRGGAAAEPRESRPQVARVEITQDRPAPDAQSDPGSPSTGPMAFRTEGPGQRSRRRRRRRGRRSGAPPAAALMGGQTEIGPATTAGPAPDKAQAETSDAGPDSTPAEAIDRPREADTVEPTVDLNPPRDRSDSENQ